MNIVRRASQQIERRMMSLGDLDSMMDLSLSGSQAYTGAYVSQDTALRVSAVWRCVYGIANDIATSPAITFEIQDPDVEPAKTHYLWSLLQQEANPLMPSIRFKHLMQTWLGLWGNAYAEIEINGRGQVTALWPWRPDRVRIYRMTLLPDAPLMYEYTMGNGTAIRLPQDRVFHLRGLSIDGVTGLSPIEYHKQTIGMSMAITEHGGRFFANGARPLGVLEYPGKLSDKAKENLSSSILDKHQGLANAHRMLILEEGMKWNGDAGCTMVDAQYLDSARFSLEDIARAYGFPLHRLQMMDRQTNNNIEYQGREYVDYTAGPLAANWESELEFSLLSPRDRSRYCVRFDLSRLSLGDQKTQAEFYGSMVNNGVMTQNEVRRRMHMNPLPNRLANVPWKQGAQVPAGDDYQPPAAKSAGVAPVKPNGHAKELTQ